MKKSDIIKKLYAEAILPDLPMPQFSKVKLLFENLTIDEFIVMVRRITEEGDFESFQLFMYYVILFRDLKNIQQFINSNEFTIDYLERLVMFTFGHCTLEGYSTERILDEIFYFLSDEKLLELVINSKYISKDKLLLFYILTKFDSTTLNTFIAKQKNMHEILEYFLKLPDETMRSIISRNYKFFQYIMLMLLEDEHTEKISKDFYLKYKDDIEQLSKLSDVINKYRKSTDLESERHLPFERRNMARISFIVNKIREMSDQNKAIEYFAGEKVFADEAEKEIVKAIISNPMFKNTFKYYDKMFID